jgi:hypothetical protein
VCGCAVEAACDNRALGRPRGLRGLVGTLTVVAASAKNGLILGGFASSVEGGGGGVE